MSARALSDIRVVEYSIGPSGAMCAKTLADMGADVIKVEPPDGDPARRLGPFPNDVPNPEASGIFLYLNANKRGITLDLTRDDDRRRLYDLVADADVFVCDLRPTDALALGIDSAKMASLSSRLIPTYVTPFGNTGPYSDWHGTDLIAWHTGGLGWESPASFVTDLEKHGPLRGRGNQAMYFAGWVAAAAAMCALFHREAYGFGQEIDVSAMDAVASHIRGNFAGYSYDISKLPQSREKAMFPWIWKVADGYASMTFFLDHWWQTMKEVMGNPDWMNDAELDTFAGRRENLELIESKVAAWALGMKRSDLFDALQTRGVPCFPVQTVDEVSASKHYAERGFFVKQKHPVAGVVRQPGATVRFSATPWSLRSPAPTLGQDNADAGFEKRGKRASLRPASPAPGDGSRNRPLDGIRVIDFGWILSVPYAGGWLGSLGAEVIRVESNTRLEPGRSALAGGADGVAGVNRSGVWNCINHSKRGVTINIRHPEGQRLVKELAAVSDVVIANFSKGVLNRLGLGYEDLRRVRPDIIMLNGSTMGDHGPDSDVTGFGPNVCSYAGQPSLTGYPGGQPQNLGGNWPDYLVGTMMVHSALSALWHRRKTGEGQSIEVAMTETITAMLPEAFLDYTMNGRVAERIGNRDPHMAPHNVYRCDGDDSWVAIAVRDNDEWGALCRLMGRDDLACDARFADLSARKRNEDALDAIVSGWTATRDPNDIAHLLQSHGIPAGPVMDVIALMADDHFRERGNIVEMDHTEVGPREVAGLPIRFGDMPRPAYYTAPLLGEHNGAVVGDLLGNDGEEVERLEEGKAVF